jgi:hypothetical protein
MSYNLGRIDPEERTALYAVPPDDEAPPRPRRVLAAGAALLVMGLFAGGLWLAYVAGLRHATGFGTGSDIPLIRADTRPIKVKPANPGGMAIPDQHMLIYDEGQPKVEHLLPPPEQPMARPNPTSPPRATPAPATPAVVLPRTAAVDGVSPTVTAGAVSAPTPIRRVPADDQMARPVDAGPGVLRQAVREPAAVETASAETGAVRLQLGSVRSEASAREEWARLRRDNADLLGSLSAFAIRTDLGDKGVYFRIETGPVASAARADRICSELRQRHFGCIIVR